MYQRRRSSSWAGRFVTPLSRSPIALRCGRGPRPNATGWDADAMAESIAWIHRSASDASSSGTARSS